MSEETHINGLALTDIDDAERAVKSVRIKLQAIGRELYEMREGEKLGREYDFHDYSRQNYAGSNYCGQDGPDWGVGTPIISITFFWSRASAEHYVTFPKAWLGQDWRSLERERLATERAELAAQAELDRQEAVRLKDEAERLTYERLKEKFASGGAAA